MRAPKNPSQISDLRNASDYASMAAERARTGGEPALAMRLVALAREVETRIVAATRPDAGLYTEGGARVG